jgi:hypothetical protein
MKAYSDYLVLSGNRDEPGKVAGMLWVVDISRTGVPVPAAQLQLEDWALELVIEGTTAYVVSPGGGGLSSIDLSDPTRPRLLDRLELPEGQHDGLDAAGDLVFYSEGDQVTVLDATDPKRMQQLSTVRIEGSGTGCYDSISGLKATLPYVYVAAPGGGIRVLDVSRPERPILVARHLIPGYTDLLEQHRGHLFHFTGYTGMFVHRAVRRTDLAAAALFLPYSALP